MNMSLAEMLADAVSELRVLRFFSLAEAVEIAAARLAEKKDPKFDSIRALPASVPISELEDSDALRQMTATLRAIREMAAPYTKMSVPRSGSAKEDMTAIDSLACSALASLGRDRVT